MSRNSQRAILRDVAKGKLKIDRKGKPVKNVVEPIVEEIAVEPIVEEIAVEPIVEPVIEEAIVLEAKVEKKKTTTTSSRKKYKKSVSLKD